MNELQELTSVGGDFTIPPAHGIAAIALTMAMKYHDIGTVQGGALYQQYKLGGIRIVQPLCRYGSWQDLCERHCRSLDEPPDCQGDLQ